MEIRSADPQRDAAACAAIYAPYVRETVISFETEPPTTQEFVARIGRTVERHPWLVGEEDGAVVAFAYAGPHRERAAYRWATDVSVYVDSRFHRRGIGRRLYLALFELLERQGFRIACAGVTLPNAASVGLHESLGFTPVGIYRRIGWKAGAWWDVGWWQRELGNGTSPGRSGEPPPEPEPRP